MTSLRARLGRLRAGGGADRAAESEGALADPASGASLRERLQRLAPGRVRAQDGGRRVMGTAELAERLGACEAAPGVLCLERHRPLAERHGRSVLAGCVQALPALAAELAAPAAAGAATGPVAGRASAAAPAAALGDVAGCGFIDTETSGLAGGTGTWVFVFGIARLEPASLRCRQYLLTRLDAEAAFLDCVSTELDAVSLLVSYNGRTFDLPLLETRLRLAGYDTGVLARAHLDLLQPVRRAFATRWPDCRLATCEQRLLGLTRDGDLSGAEAPAAWLDWLRRGEPQRLGAVLRHNRLDLLSLAALVPVLAAIEADPPAFDADLCALARSRIRRGDPGAARALLQRAGSALGAEEALVLAALHRRCGASAEALAIWQRLAAGAEPRALLELAKHHEHRSGDLEQALALALRLPAGAEQARRCARLRAKLARRGAAAAAPVTGSRGA